MNEYDRKTVKRFLWNQNKWIGIAGRRYENFVAKQLELDGWEVHRNYRHNLHDHGIDIIAYREKTARFIQCKARRAGSLVHVNTVYQLYGAVAANSDTSVQDSRVETFIYTSSGLDPNAKEKASKLGIRVELVAFPPYRYR